MAKQQPELLVKPDWLAARLSDPTVRVFDCTLTRLPQPSGPSLWGSGRSAWKECHIPGSDYIHMVEDLSDPGSSAPFTLPSSAAVGELMSRFGVDSGSTVVLYGGGYASVVHRVWWVLRASGLEDVRILNIGLDSWIDEGHPAESGERSFEPSDFVSNTEPAFVVSREDVERSLDDPLTCLINALSEDLFLGEGNQAFGRRGRIPGSINIPAETLLDPMTGQLLPVDDLKVALQTERLSHFDTLIPYCGGGIAASTVFFALTLVGHDNVALYDGSLLDWAADPELPMVTGPERIVS